jgi:hypothetical protein
MSNDSNSNRERRNVFGLMNRLFRLDNAEGTTSTSSTAERVVPSFFPRRSGRRPREENNSNNIYLILDFNSIECREAIRQNFATIENFIQTANTNVNLTNSYNDNKTIELFNFKNRKLYKGQWVDVKDTIDQWLEAQIIDVKDNKVYIHYNGWGTRWDEWIDMNSDRIMPFRYHTQQTNIYNYHSPYPNHKPDADVSMQGNINSDFFDFFKELQNSFNSANYLIQDIDRKRENQLNANINNNFGNILNQMDSNNDLNNQLDVYYLTKSLVPLLDRLGRIMTDMGAYINFNMKNNRLEE